MPISGLVITLANPAAAEELARVLLSHEPRLQLGELQVDRLPCVLETADAKESEAVHDWLLGQPGVLGVDVVFVSFDEATDASSGGSHAGN